MINSMEPVGYPSSSTCETQKEADELWEKLSEAGTEIQCGWLKDKYGLSWQIVPTTLFELLQDKDPQASERVIKALFHMKNLEIATLERAYRGMATDDVVT
jgi:predicted 3-demethylubiquinone-9 3-methyltransferase (glyoxalase superfamily)